MQINGVQMETFAKVNTSNLTCVSYKVSKENSMFQTLLGFASKTQRSQY